MLPRPPYFEDVAILLMRLLVALIFITSGWDALKDPQARAKDTGIGTGFAILLGWAEALGGLGLVFGVLTQFAALGFIIILLGAIQKKIFAWHIGFYGENTYGWDYESLLVLMNLTIVATNGGAFTLLKWDLFR
jgi:putative oxidoreductase